MKLDALRPGAIRCYAAALRNSLSDERIPPICCIRKCRRDGVCAGPLLREAKDGWRLARSLDDIADGEALAPICYLLITPEKRKRALEATNAKWRDLRNRFSATFTETTRTLAARPWRRLRG